MGKINWGRVFLGGVLFGLVGGVLIFLDVLLLGKDFLAAVLAAGQVPDSKAVWLGMCVSAGILVGIWTIWLYAAIRPRYGPGPKTAVIAGLAVSLFGILADAMWAWMGFIPPAVIVAPVAGAVPAIIVATLVGAWPYKE